jgi:glycyl-tRNA synthetase beta chain
MSELLLELFSEEIPARMQKRAGEDLSRLVTDALKAAGVESAKPRAFAAPRRLTLVIDGLPEKTPDVKEERKGPKVGAPDKAIEGFLRAAGLSSIDEASVQDDKKGAFYLATIEKPGRATADLIAEIVPDVIRTFPWPKSMRWGAGQLRWVRPLHSILCILDGKIVPIELEGISSDSMSYGHRFMAPDGFSVTSFADYEAGLEKAFVILDPAKRAARIHEQALFLAKEEGLHLVEDEALLHEVAGLVEWPMPFVGKIDDDFMTVPQEVLTSTMRANQKYFALKDAKGKLAPRFIVVANIAAADGGKAIVNGNERVLRARFSDARFLWDQDRKATLESRMARLKEVVFHAKIGTMADKAMWISIAAETLVDEIPGVNSDVAGETARIAKADLVSGMVFEFPELQGVIGGYLAQNDGLGDDVATAIAEHYRPLGPSDDVPTTVLGRIISIADKVDTLVAFWAIDEKPTGSKDPFALRRAALGVIRILIENDYRVHLEKLFFSLASLRLFVVRTRAEKAREEKVQTTIEGFLGKGQAPQEITKALREANPASATDVAKLDDEARAVARDLLAFFADRLKVYLRDRGARHDLVDAVFALATDEDPQDDLVLIMKRVEALSGFLATDDGANLLAGYKRAVNILKIEEKKDGVSFDAAPDKSKLVEPEEKTLAAAIDEAAKEARAAVAAEDFAAAMSGLAKLRAPVDAFFEKVKVNDEGFRENRLRLLAQIRAALHAVADFSKVEG